MTRSGIFVYAIAAYILFLASFLYFLGFLACLPVPQAADAAPVAGPLRGTLINTGLVALFALQHLIMARPWFKRQLVRLVPAPAERSTFVLSASILLALLCFFRQPVPPVIWQFDSPLFRLVPRFAFLIGCGLVVYTSFLIDHWDLFGLRQAYLHYRNVPYTPVPFKVNSLYRHIRHPMMLGFLMILWFTPVMTVDRLTLAVEFTAFIFAGIWFEERELAGSFGQAYLDYKKKTSMVIPKEKTRAEKVDRQPGRI